MPSIEQSFYLLNTDTVLFFSIIACSVLMALVFYYNDMYVRKGNNARIPAIFRFCLLPKEPS